MVTPQSNSVRSRRRPNGDGHRNVRLAHEEFWTLWHEHEAFLLRICLKHMKGNKAEAEEALSGAMMRALDGTTTEKLPHIGNVRAWLARIVHNHCVDLQRQQLRDPLAAEDLEGLLYQLDLISGTGTEGSPEEGIVRAEDYQHLRWAIESLPERLREVMVLRAYENMPYKDIALHLCITPEAARKRAEQARAIIAQRLRRDGMSAARGHRRPHDGELMPRSERRAADAVLARPPHVEPAPASYAHLRLLRLPDGRQVEDLLFLDRKPMRIRQRQGPLLRYIREHPGGWTRHRQYADLLVAEGRLEEAIPYYRTVLERQPQLLEVCEDLARILVQLGKREMARQVLSAFGPRSGDPALLSHFQAMRAWLSGDAGRAGIAWEDALRLSGGGARYVRSMARFLLQQDAPMRALNLLEEGLRRAPDDREAVHLALQAAISAGLPLRFSQVLDQAGSTFPKDPHLRVYALVDRIGRGQIAGDEHSAISREVSRLKAQLRGFSAVVHLQASWLFHRKREDRCRDLILEL